MATTYLTRTVSSATNRRTFTISFWVKKSGFANQQTIFSAGASASSYLNFLGFTADRLGYWEYSNSTTNLSDLQTNRLFRDPNAWYHIVVSVDTTQATSSNRIKFYVNGVQETSFSTETYPSQNQELTFCNNTNHFIGRYGYTSSFYLDGSLSHFHFIDGIAYDASTFGESDSTSGIWKPKTAPSVTYGTNGFFLKFENSGSMGLDSSGNTNNFSISAGTITQTEDTPSNNFATGNPLHVDGTSASAFINGNLTHTNNVSAVSTLAINKGKWYMEFKRQDNGGSITNWMYCGFVKADRTGLRLYRSSNGDYYNGSSYSSYGASWGDGDIVGVALDYDNDTIEFYKNGTSQGSKTSIGICDGDYVLPIWQCSQSSGSPYFHANFGNGKFGTSSVASSNSDGDGLGLFEYSVPSGYYSLCTKNIKNYG